jgi:exosortase
MNVPELIEEPTRNPWITAGGWLLLGAALVAAFGHNFAEMWLRWFPAWHRTSLGLYERIVEGESYYTHGPLVPPVSLIIVLLLIRHTRVPVRPWRVTGFAVVAMSLLLHLTACLARVNFASAFAFIGVLVGLVLVLWGGKALRRLWFPIVLLIFMVPLPEISIAQLNFRLKMFAANWGVELSNAIGVAAERIGNRVLLEGDKDLVIANVCNGLRTLISLLAFGTIYAYVCRLRGLWRIGLFAMTVPVAVASNTIRVVSLILVADRWDVQTATGWYHDASA